MIPVDRDHTGEQTLMTARPTRYIAFGSYVVLIVCILLAPFVYFEPWFLTGTLGTAIGPVTVRDVVIAFLLVVAVYALIRAELKRATTFYVITDNKIIRRDGILSKNTQMVPYTQLERVDLNQTLGQRILHIGTVVVDTGDDVLKIEQVPHPEKIQELLSQRLGRRAYTAQR